MLHTLKIETKTLPILYLFYTLLFKDVFEDNRGNFALAITFTFLLNKILAIFKQDDGSKSFQSDPY